MFPYYGATGVMDYVDDFLFEGLHLLVAEDGSVERSDGKPFLQLVDGQFWVNNHAHVLRGATDEDTKYLYYALSTVPVRPYMSGSVQAKLSQANLNRIPIPYPVQGADRRAIAHILGTLDDKIELNRRMSETLEAMARALFKAWFVDFEPVRAKMEGRWRRGETLPGLPAHLYDLFPDRLVESELGEIPEGWELASLTEFSSLNPEAWTKRTRPEQIRYVDLSNTKWGRIESVTNYDADDAPSRAQRVLRPLDTIVGTVRPGNGSYALISDDGLTASTGFAVLRPLRRECAEFVYLAATARENIERLSNLADGGAYPAVRPEIVSATQVPRAGEKLINEFSRQVSSMLAGIAANERTSRSLAQLRDTLLPKLISGELRVPDAERILREAEKA
ncbi:restriction endonuclease subunit S [Burkholderia multivorans]|uniref:restriction endonuclease subunit S n=1 Tax=Burkholderia multivorans TaxID=87883 RepID=UPI0015E37E63